MTDFQTKSMNTIMETTIDFEAPFVVFPTDKGKDRSAARVVVRFEVVGPMKAKGENTVDIIEWAFYDNTGRPIYGIDYDKWDGYSGGPGAGVRKVRDAIEDIIR